MFTVHVTRHLNAMGLCFVCTCRLCSSRGCWHRGRLFRFYRVAWWRSGYFVSLTVGRMVVTEPFDLTSLVEDTRSPFQIGCKHFFGSICEPTRVGTFVICCRQRHASEKKARIAVTTHNRIISGGAVMPFTRCSVPACRQVVPMSSISFFGCHFAHEKRTLQGTPKDMCTGKSRHMRSRQQYFMVVCKRHTVHKLRPSAVGFHVSACHRSFCG